jgi:23S rRNA (cytosine1962-C5)-methyltransferase
VLACLIFEDDHLLVLNKPPGVNTHAPSPYAGEGLYDWLRNREARWANLSIIHRLDKETSGVILFGKTSLANRSLTQQFTNRTVKKKYLLLTDRNPPRTAITVRSALKRAGDKYLSHPARSNEECAQTRFEPTELTVVLGSPDEEPKMGPKTQPLALIAAIPRTGRTHQIRVHASQAGFPILGDVLYGGKPAPRVYLHAAELALVHPATGEEVTFSAPVDFASPAQGFLRSWLIDAETTNSYRALHGASDGWPEWYLDRLGDFLLSQSEQPLSERQRGALVKLMEAFPSRGAYHKVLSRQVRQSAPAEASPQLVLGLAASPGFVIRENGLNFELSFQEGYSVGLFLDQRDNRRRLLTRHVAAGFSLFPDQGQAATVPQSEPSGPASLLNAFAYTCGFSVCAAKAGFHTTSLDLSRKYLEWGKRNFGLNKMDPAQHEFIYGDVFDWLRRLARKDRFFDVILLDPPTFSQSRQSGTFRAEKDYGRLVTAALPLLHPGGVLFCSSNAARWAAEEFLANVEGAIRASSRTVPQKHYAPQPPDFPVSRSEPAYLKTVWLRIE